MSANVQIVTLFVALVLAAAAIRAAVGPIPAPADGQSLYAVSKAGPATGPLADTVELAVSDAR
jgi:hypothetical protein